MKKTIIRVCFILLGLILLAFILHTIVNGTSFLEVIKKMHGG